MVVNKACYLRQELGQAQMARIAAHAALRNNIILFEYLTSDTTGGIMSFLELALATRPPSFQELLLCPMDTPFLIDNHILREKLGQLNITPPSDLRRLIVPFIQRFYPGNWEALEQCVRTAHENLLPHFITEPGSLHTYFLRQNQHCPFSPPLWISFSTSDSPTDDESDEGDS